jgi:spermidine synthase
MATEDTAPAAASGDTRLTVSDRNLFLVSVLGLFLELLVIRWVCSEVQLFNYLQNTVLVVCFLGLGMGCLTCRQPTSLRHLLMPLLILAAILTVPYTRETFQRLGLLLHFFGTKDWTDVFVTDTGAALANTGVGLVLMLLILLVVWDVFVPIGRMLGRLMDDHPQTIRAYSVNVGGSLIGIWLFVLLSALYQPPLTWFLVVAGLVLWLFGAARLLRRLDVVLLGAVVAFAGLASFNPHTYEVWWSPYQKLMLVEPDHSPEARNSWLGIGKYLITVGPGPYQAMLDLRPEHIASAPQEYPADMAGLSQYDIPALLQPQARKVLIVGAGSGNDAAGILRHGTPEITAVDIDPAIIALGKKYHPEHPYDSPHVHIVNDDARSYFATCTERYDLIVFGLLDAHAATATTNNRLDYYVYTRESLRGARALLADSGVLVLTFEAMQPFIPERMLEALTDVFGQEPIHFRIFPGPYGWGGVLFAASEDMPALQQRIAANPRLSQHIAEWQRAYPIVRSGQLPLATDDWPYIYLETPRIPPLFFLFLFVLLILFWRGLRWGVKGPGMFQAWDRSHWHFLFLGAAFMLLEVQNISKAAVVLGNTWQVNAVIISAILVLILLANLIAARLPRLPLTLVYLLLWGSCLGLYGVDLARFAFLPYVVKAVVVGALSSLPILFSGIVFIRSFVAVPRKDTVLGANLLGALIGGLLQTITFLTGIKALLLIVAALYFLAWLTRPAAGVSQSAAPEAAPTSEAVPVS